MNEPLNITTVIEGISSITKGPRQSNFELLRIIAMFLILVLHANFLSIGPPRSNDFLISPLNSFTRTIIESLSIVSVNVFVLISGWFGIRPSFKGFFNFVFQCAYFSFGIYFLLLIFGQAKLSLNGLMGCLYLMSSNWFVKAYAALYILSPVINVFIEHSSRRRIEIFLIAFFIFQTIWGWTNAAKFIENGYSTFSFIGLYVSARYVRQRLNKTLRHYKSSAYWGGVFCFHFPNLIHLLSVC